MTDLKSSKKHFYLHCEKSRTGWHDSNSNHTCVFCGEYPVLTAREADAEIELLNTLLAEPNYCARCGANDETSSPYLSYTVGALRARFADESMPWTRAHVAELIQMIETLTRERDELGGTRQT